MAGALLVVYWGKRFVKGYDGYGVFVRRRGSSQRSRCVQIGSVVSVGTKSIKGSRVPSFAVEAFVFIDAAGDEPVFFSNSQFFAAQIHQNEFRVAYSPIGVPAQAAWMFHMILTLLRIVGFEGDDITVSSLLGGALATYVEETKLGIPVILDYKEHDPSAHISLYFSRRCKPTTLAKIPVQEHRLDAYELSEMVSGWKGPIGFEIHSKDLPSSIDAVVAAEQVLNLGLQGTLDTVNNVNLQGFPYEDLRIRRAWLVRSWNMPGGMADRRTKKERQSPGASS
ncbi:hypothetical protein B0H11DRAFT_1899170 [Mycena galericulata]|nr:hypothetical protein B0H11DRAFT_1899170 [Mycena galericulata]